MKKLRELSVVELDIKLHNSIHHCLSTIPLPSQIALNALYSCILYSDWDLFSVGPAQFVSLSAIRKCELMIGIVCLADYNHQEKLTDETLAFVESLENQIELLKDRAVN